MKQPKNRNVKYMIKFKSSQNLRQEINTLKQELAKAQEEYRTGLTFFSRVMKTAGTGVALVGGYGVYRLLR